MLYSEFYVQIRILSRFYCRFHQTWIESIYLLESERCNISQNSAPHALIIQAHLSGHLSHHRLISDNREQLVAIDFIPAGEFTQETRHLKIQTGLADDLLLLRRFQGTEGISQLFQFELDLLSHNGQINPQDIVGDNVSISIAPEGEEPRFSTALLKHFNTRAWRSADFMPIKPRWCPGSGFSASARIAASFRTRRYRKLWNPFLMNSVSRITFSRWWVNTPN